MKKNEKKSKTTNGGYSIDDILGKNPVLGHHGLLFDVLPNPANFGDIVRIYIADPKSKKVAYVARPLVFDKYHSGTVPTVCMAINTESEENLMNNLWQHGVRPMEKYTLGDLLALRAETRNEAIRINEELLKQREEKAFDDRGWIYRMFNKRPKTNERKDNE